MATAHSGSSLQWYRFESLSMTCYLYSIALICYCCFRSSSNPDLGQDADAEVGGILSRGLDRTNSMRTGIWVVVFLVKILLLTS